jgi:predicted acylesterase/phospholipase RssA
MIQPSHSDNLAHTTAKWQEIVNSNSLVGITHSIKKVFTGIFYPPNIKKEQNEVIDLFERFLKAFTKESSLFQPEANEESIILNGQKLFEELKNTHLAPQDGLKSIESFNKAIVNANHDAKYRTFLIREPLVDKQLDDSRKRVPDKRPKFIAKKIGIDPKTGQAVTILTAIVKAPDIIKYIISGGGGKGYVITVLWEELQKNGLLEHFEKVIGSSVGAISATLFSVMKAEKCQTFIDNNPIITFTKDVPGFKQLYPNVAFENTKLWRQIAIYIAKKQSSGHSGQKALQLLDKETSKEAQNYLKSNWDKIFPTDPKKSISPEITPVDKTRLSLLKNQNIESKIDRTKYLLTFKDLQLLHEIAPDTFKELEITGFNKDDQVLEVFNAKNTPNMSVALATRISMALPPVFQLVKTDPKGDGKIKTYADGGFGANTHLDVIKVINPEDQKNQDVFNELTDTTNQQQTAALIFNGGGYGHDAQGIRDTKAVFSTEERKQMKTYANFVGLDPDKNIKNAEADAKRIYELGPNGLIINHGEMETLSLNPDKNERLLAKIDARVTIKEQILARKNQATLVSVSSVKALFERLSKDEKLAIVTGGEPIKPEFRQQNKHETDESYERSKALSEENSNTVHSLDCELYQLCKSEVGIEKAENAREELHPIPMSARLRSISGSSSNSSSSSSLTISDNKDNSPEVTLENSNSPHDSEDQTTVYLEKVQGDLLRHLNGKTLMYNYILATKLASHKNETRFENNAIRYVDKQLEAKPINQSIDDYDKIVKDLFEKARAIQAHELLLLEVKKIEIEDLVIAESKTSSNQNNI